LVSAPGGSASVSQPRHFDAHSTVVTERDDDLVVVIRRAIEPDGEHLGAQHKSPKTLTDLPVSAHSGQVRREIIS
jgi:hypothetical protein